MSLQLIELFENVISEGSGGHSAENMNGDHLWFPRGPVNLTKLAAAAEDHLKVTPEKVKQAVLNAMEERGFKANKDGSLSIGFEVNPDMQIYKPGEVKFVEERPYTKEQLESMYKEGKRCGADCDGDCSCGGIYRTKEQSHCYLDTIADREDPDRHGA